MATSSTKETKEELDKIAELLKRGGDYSCYEEFLDNLLGTKMKERDSEAEEIFERGHRE